MAWYISWYDFMRTDLGLKGSELYVYAVIYGFTKSKGAFSGSLNYLEEVTGFDKRHCFRTVKKLTEKGVIKKTVVSTRKIEYTAVPLDELKLDDKTAANASNLTLNCETQSRVSNHITEDKNAICKQIDAINDKPPNQPTEYGNKMLAKIKASIQK